MSEINLIVLKNNFKSVSRELETKKAQVDELNKKNDELKQKNDELKQENEELEQQVEEAGKIKEQIESLMVNDFDGSSSFTSILNLDDKELPEQQTVKVSYVRLSFGTEYIPYSATLEIGLAEPIICIDTTTHQQEELHEIWVDSSLLNCVPKANFPLKDMATYAMVGDPGWGPERCILFKVGEYYIGTKAEGNMYDFGTPQQDVYLTVWYDLQDVEFKGQLSQPAIFIPTIPENN